MVLIWSKPLSLNFGGGFRNPRHGVLSGLRLSHLGVDLEETLKKELLTLRQSSLIYPRIVASLWDMDKHMAPGDKQVMRNPYHDE